MESLHPEALIANIDEEGGAAAARESLAAAGAALIERAAALGLAERTATLCRHDPLEAGGALRDMVFGMARSVPEDAFGALDGHGPSLEAGGRTYRRAEATPGRAMTVSGPVDFLRSRHRPPGTGASLVPAGAVPGLTACGMTPPAAGLSMYLMSGLTARESEDAWRRICGRGPSAASPVRLSAAVGVCMEERSGELMEDLRAREEMPDEAVPLLVSPAGVMMRMNAGAEAGSKRLKHGVLYLS